MLVEWVEVGVIVGPRLAIELVAGIGMAFKVSDLVRDVGSFDTMVTSLELLC